MKKFLLLIVVLVLLAAGALALLNFVFDKEKTKRYTVPGEVTELIVKSGSGNVELVAGGDVVEVRETQHYVFDKPTLERDVSGGVLTLESDCDAKLALRCYSDLHVAVPAGIRVTVEADSGDVDARGVDVRDAHLQSDSGDVRLDLIGRQTLAWAHTDSGDVEVITRDADAIDAQTDSGEVKVDADGAPRKIVAITDSGNVEVAVAAGPYAIDADSDSGDAIIEGLQRNDDAPQSIQARTDSGDVKLRAR